MYNFKLYNSLSEFQAIVTT